MGTARIVEDYWNCGKRWDLEGYVFDRGHRWPKQPDGRPMSAAECGANVLHWLDERSDPSGRLDDVTPAMLERRARWTGKPGLLYEALVATKWIDRDAAGGTRWHDYWSLNGETIKARLKKARQRAEDGGQEGGTHRGDKEGGHDPGTTRGDDQGGQDPPALGSGSGPLLRGAKAPSGGVCSGVSSARAKGSRRTTTDSPSAPSEAAPRPDPQTQPQHPEPLASEADDLLDKIADLLHDSCGGAWDACRKAVSEAIAAGVKSKWLHARTLSHPPEEGSSVFDWKRDSVAAFDAENGGPKSPSAKGTWRPPNGPAPPDTNGATLRRIEAQRATEAEQEAAFDEWRARPENAGKGRLAFLAERTGKVPPGRIATTSNGQDPGGDGGAAGPAATHAGVPAGGAS